MISYWSLSVISYWSNHSLPFIFRTVSGVLDAHKDRASRRRLAVKTPALITGTRRSETSTCAPSWTALSLTVRSVAR